MKNFKLLLATTAILSTGALAVFAATTSVEPTSIGISVSIGQAISLTTGEIDFGVITNAGGRVLKIDQFGNVIQDGSNAQYLGKAHTSPIVVKGGVLSNNISTYNGAAAGYRATLADDNATAEQKASAQAGIDALSTAFSYYNLNFELENNGVMTLTDDGGDTCGEVTVSAPQIRYRTQGENYSEAVLEFYYGGTFEMVQGYNGNGNCAANMHATLFAE